MQGNRWLLALLLAAPYCASGASFLLVLNKGDNTLATVDAATLQVKGRAPPDPIPMK